MNTETQVPTGEETQNQAPESVEVKPEGTEPEAVEMKTEEDETQKSIKRLQRRIDKRTSDVYRERARAEQLEAELQKLRGQSEPTPQQELDVDARAEQIAEAKLFAKTAERIVEGGKKSNPDFIEKLKDLASEVGEFVQPNGLPSKFMKAVLDVSEKPTELLYYLGKNPDIAGELSDLPVTKLAARLDRIERSLAEPQPKQSSAPKPLEPVKPRAKTSDLPSDDDSPDEWMKKEYARMKAKGLLSG